jgi:hypothetical protein
MIFIINNLEFLTHVWYPGAVDWAKPESRDCPVQTTVSVVDI